jgi:ATP-dependent Clp protease protease subunit
MVAISSARYVPPGLPSPSPPGDDRPDAGLAPWLEERLLGHRIVLLRGPLTNDAAARAAAGLLTLDADKDPSPVRLHLSVPEGDLVAMFAVMDTLDSMAAEVHAICSAELGGVALGVLVAASRRLAQPHTRFRLAEPRFAGVSGTADQVAAAAGRHLRDLEELVVRVAAVTGQTRSRVEDDFAANIVFGVDEARDYGLIDEIIGPSAG